MRQAVQGLIDGALRDGGILGPPPYGTVRDPIERHPAAGEGVDLRQHVLAGSRSHRRTARAPQAGSRGGQVTAPEVAKLVAVLMAALPGAHVGPQTSAVYERMLADLDFETARVAVEQVLATWRYASMLPSVAEIRDRVMALKHGEVSAGGEAWGLVQRAIASRGRNRTPGVDFELEPVALETVRALGWVNLCSSETPAADRARFIELYDQLAARGRREVVVRTLPATAQLRELAASVAKLCGSIDDVVSPEEYAAAKFAMGDGPVLTKDQANELCDRERDRVIAALTAKGKL